MKLIHLTEGVAEPTGNGRRSDWKQRLLRVIAVTAVALVGVTGSAITSPAAPAFAATHGPGGNWNQNGDFIGAFIQPDGSLVYCADSEVKYQNFEGSGGITSTLTTHPGGGTRSVSGDDLKKINYAIYTHGQTSSSTMAAAVQAYVWTMTNSDGHDGNYYLGNAPQEARDLYAYVANDTNANFNSGGGGSGTVDMIFNVDPVNNYIGTLNIQNMSPSNAVGTISLTNGVFADTGLPTRDGVTNNSSLPVTGVPPEDTVEYKISAEAAFRGNGQPAFDANVTVYGSIPSGWQRGIGMGSSTPGVVSFEARAADPAPRSTIFQPVIGTRVASKFIDVSADETLADIVTFATAPDENGRDNPWYVNGAGRYAPITGKGSIYYTGSVPPIESDDAPANAMLVASDITVTSTPEDGPTVDYTVDSGYIPEETGYYTWVWEIAYEEQSSASPNVQQFLPEGYYFKDRFGQVRETSIRASEPVITTAVTEGLVPVLGESQDQVSITTQNGGWMQSGGARVPVTLTGTAYYSETRPELADEAPAGAEILGVTTLVFDKAGSTVSNAIATPLKEGFITYQWCLIEANQPAEFQGMFRETCDMYGQASETSEIRKPDVTTQARELATIYDPLYDVGIVNGPVPGNTSIRATLFKKPEVGDFKRVDGQPTSEVWTEEEIANIGDDAVCTVENLIETTAPVPVAPGNNDNEHYQMPDVYVDEEGVYWWIEDTFQTNPETGEETIISSGECGLPNETTIVDKPRVTTKAVTEAFPGDNIWDIAIVTGPLSDREDITYDLTWQAYHRASGTTTAPDEKLCTADTLVWESSSSLAITAAGEYKSQELKLKDEHLGEILWVESLSMTIGEEGSQVIHRGECGAATEITKVTKKPVLPNTGGTANSIAIGSIAGGLLLAGAAAAGVTAIRRKKASV